MTVVSHDVMRDDGVIGFSKTHSSGTGFNDVIRESEVRHPTSAEPHAAISNGIVHDGPMSRTER